MMLVTHAIFGTVVGRLLSLNLGLVFLGSVLPDIDHLLNIPHRTFTHSILFVFLIAALFALKKKSWGISIGVGIATHLFMDSITVTGVPLFYPFGTNFIIGITKAADLTSNLIIIGISVTTLVIYESWIHMNQNQ